MQINLTGFLENNAKVFVKELWNLLLSAQNSVGGIPAIFIEQKKEELRKKREREEAKRAERDSVMETIKRRRNEEMDDLKEERKSRFVSWAVCCHVNPFILFYFSSRITVVEVESEEERVIVHLDPVLVLQEDIIVVMKEIVTIADMMIDTVIVNQEGEGVQDISLLLLVVLFYIKDHSSSIVHDWSFLWVLSATFSLFSPL